MSDLTPKQAADLADFAKAHEAVENLERLDRGEAGKKVPVYNGRIVAYEPITIFEIDHGGEWQSYVPKSEYDRDLNEARAENQRLSNACCPCHESAEQRLEEARTALDWALNWVVANGVVPEPTAQPPITRPAALPSDIEEFDSASKVLAALDSSEQAAGTDESPQDQWARESDQHMLAVESEQSPSEHPSEGATK
jgi:hypothetical protein